MLRAALAAALALASACADGGFSYAEKIRLRDTVRDMHDHAVRSYMKHGYPHDEVMPLSCQGRRWDKRRRGTLDDCLGGYLLTLVDGADTMLVVGDRAAFGRTMDILEKELTLDRDVYVSTFEATIRVLGGLLSAHYLVTEPALAADVRTAAVLAGHRRDPDRAVRTWAASLRGQAEDLGARLLPAFSTPTGIPAHRVNLRHGVGLRESRTTCSAAAGSLLVEMAALSRLTGDGRYERAARRAVDALWQRRGATTGLVGSTVNTHTGDWLSAHTGVGAGVDSYWEYLVKAALAADDPALLKRGVLGVRSAHGATARRDARRNLTWQFDVQREDATKVTSTRVSALQAFWPSLLLLAGFEVTAARESFKAFWHVWRRYRSLPEVFDTRADAVVDWARDSPLRPELAESALHLHLATGDAHYLVVGRSLVDALNDISRVPCGFAAIADADTHRLDDRMDSYFFAETLKYLFLLFDLSLDPADRQSFFCADDDGVSAPGRACLPLDAALFSTEGHLIPLPESDEPRGPFGSPRFAERLEEAGAEPATCNATGY
mmetsp:Transcript_7137/g.21023  ORF Transcript_7137/g.21023 Transcript_7137/m.21023 type:complete len:550 (-) Transcript_7137:23-1672(-)